MQASQISFKIYFDAQNVQIEDFIPVFHGWIRDRKLDDDVTIDVADYAHVPEGPGVLLVCHEGHYVVERRQGRWSLSYNRKRGGVGDDLDLRLGTSLRRVATAARLLRDDATLSEKLRFATDALQLRVQNRLHAANDDATLAAIEPDLRRLLTSRYGDATIELRRRGEPRELFTVDIQAERSPPLEALAGL